MGGLNGEVLLHMMYDLQYRRPDLIAFSDKNIVLRSSSKTVFMYDKLYSDIYFKSPYIRGNTLWKQLPSNIQQTKTKSEFKSKLQMMCWKMFKI